MNPLEFAESWIEHLVSSHEKSTCFDKGKDTNLQRPNRYDK